MKASVHISHFIEGKYLSGQRGATGWGKIFPAYVLQPTRLNVFFFWWARETLTTKYVSSVVKCRQSEPPASRASYCEDNIGTQASVRCVAQGSREEVVAVLLSVSYHPILHSRAS